MASLILAILVTLAVVVGAPLLVIGMLFSRTRQLRRDVEELRTRLHRLEGVGPRDVPEATEVSLVEPPPVPVPHPAAPVAPMRSFHLHRPRVETEDQPKPPEESLESRIGGRWLLNIGIAAIVIGVAYFEKWAIDNRWIGETARVIQGGLFGAALMVAGNRITRRGYSVYGQMLTGGGVAILYVSTYAAFVFYHLIGRPIAFTLMIATTALGALLADRERSQGLAVLAVGGGFVTPFLLHGNADAQRALFTYVAIMTAGTVFLARRHAWPLLNIISYLFTLLTVAAWADRFYSAEKYLRTEVFLTVYCAMFVAIARSSRRLESMFAEFVAWFLWTAPLAYYGASLLVLQDHPMPLLVWLIGVALLSGIVSHFVGTGSAIVVWLAAAFPLLTWTQAHANLTWLTPGLAAIAALYLIALASQLRTVGESREAKPLDLLWTHLSALLMFAGAYFMLEATHLAWTGPVAVAFAGWHGLLTAMFWTRDRDRAVHFAALAFTLLSIAIALQFDGPAVTVGWAAEGSAVIALGLFERREWMRIGGLLLFAVAVLRTLDMLFSPPLANHVVLFNTRAACALLVVALAYAMAWLHRRDTNPASRDLSIASGIIVAQVVSLVLLTSEIHAHFAIRNDAFTRELLVSVSWAVYATILIVIGLQRRYAPLRYFAFGLFALTIGKVFFSDLAELERIYRVMSLVALGMTLLLTSWLYQRIARNDGASQGIDDLIGRG
jgi:uncharacterized membrane protein